MDKIVLEVDDTVGKVFRSMSLKGKQQLNQAISMVLKKAANDARFSDYSKLLDDTGSEAVRNGLTPELLNELLNSND